MDFIKNKLKITGYRDLMTLLLILLPVFVYSYYFIRYSVNFPIEDDFDFIVNMLNSFIEAPNITEKLGILFSQHNTHIIVFYRLFFVAEYYLFGSVEFLTPVILGNLSWIFAVYFLHKTFTNVPRYFFVFASLVVFNVQYYITLEWSAIFFYNIFFASLAFHFIQKEKTIYLFLALLVSTLAIFNVGNGFLIFLLLIFYYVLNKKFNWKLIVLVVFSAIVIYAYFALFSMEKLTAENHFGFDTIIKILQYTEIYLTSIFGIKDPILILSHVVTLVYAAMVFYLIKTRYYMKNQAFTLMVLLLLGTAMVTGYGRLEFGIYQGAAHRYRLVPSLFASLLVFGVLDAGFLKGRWLKISSIALISLASLFFIASAYVYRTDIINFYNTNKTGAFLYKNDISKTELPFPFTQKHPKDILDKAIETGYFNVPDYNAESLEIWVNEYATPPVEEQMVIEPSFELRQISSNKDYVYVSVKEKRAHMFPYTLYAGFNDGKSITYFKLKPQHIRHHRINKGCYGALIPRKLIANGKYDVTLRAYFQTHYRLVPLQKIDLSE